MERGAVGLRAGRGELLPQQLATVGRPDEPVGLRTERRDTHRGSSVDLDRGHSVGHALGRRLEGKKGPVRRPFRVVFERGRVGQASIAGPIGADQEEIPWPSADRWTAFRGCRLGQPIRQPDIRQGAAIGRPGHPIVEQARSARQPVSVRAVCSDDVDRRSPRFARGVICNIDGEGDPAAIGRPDRRIV